MFVTDDFVDEKEPGSESPILGLLLRALLGGPEKDSDSDDKHENNGDESVELSVKGSATDIPENLNTEKAASGVAHSLESDDAQVVHVSIAGSVLADAKEIASHSHHSENIEPVVSPDVLITQAKVILSQLKRDLRSKVSEQYHEEINKFTKAVYVQFKARDSIEDFKVWCAKEIQNTKDIFKVDFSIWHDVIRPALVGFLGVLVALVTSPFLPFSESTRQYVGSFFAKPQREEEKDLEVFNSHVSHATATLFNLVAEVKEISAEEGHMSQAGSQFGG